MIANKGMKEKEMQQQMHVFKNRHKQHNQITQSAIFIQFAIFIIGFIIVIPGVHVK